MLREPTPAHSRPGNLANNYTATGEALARLGMRREAQAAFEQGAWRSGRSWPTSIPEQPVPEVAGPGVTVAVG